MLRYDGPADAPTDRPIRRFLILVLLMAVRDKADQIRFRHTPDLLSLWYRVDGQWYELVPPPRHVCPDLLAEVRRISRLVAPEIGTGWRGWLRGRFARSEGLAAGWFTFRFRGRDLLYTVRLDPDPNRGEIVLDSVGPVPDPDVAAAGLREMLPRDADGPFVEFEG